MTNSPALIDAAAAGSRWTASFDVRIVQSILEAERIASFRQFAELHTVHDRNLLEVVMALAREVQDLLQVLIRFWRISPRRRARPLCRTDIPSWPAHWHRNHAGSRRAPPCPVGIRSENCPGGLRHAQRLEPSKVNAIPNQPGNDGTHHSSAGAT